MHHRTWIPLLLLLVLPAVSGGWAPAAKPTQPRPRTQVIRLLWLQTSSHVSRDRSSWTSKLENETRQFGKPAGATVGSELGFSDGFRASGAITLPGGVLEFGGPLKAKGNAGLELAITGGAGAFAGAAGRYSRHTGSKATLLLRIRYR